MTNCQGYFVLRAVLAAFSRSGSISGPHTCRIMAVHVKQFIGYSGAHVCIAGTLDTNIEKGALYDDSCFITNLL